jgi:hypothetical protein
MFSQSTLEALLKYPIVFEVEINQQKISSTHFSDQETSGSLSIKKSIVDLFNINHLVDYEVKSDELF